MLDTNLMTRQELVDLVKQQESTIKQQESIIEHQSRVVGDQNDLIAVMRKNRLIPGRNRPQKVFPPMASPTPEPIQKPPIQDAENLPAGGFEYEPKTVVGIRMDARYGDELADDNDLAEILADTSQRMVIGVQADGSPIFTYSTALDRKNEKPVRTDDFSKKYGDYDICPNNEDYFKQCCKDYPGLYMPKETFRDRVRNWWSDIWKKCVEAPDYSDEEAG